jgi:HK97 family phage prohead protease
MTLSSEKTLLVEAFGDFVDDFLRQRDPSTLLKSDATSVSPIFDLASDLIVKSQGDGARRLFTGWGSVEIKDRDNDKISIDAIKKVMTKVMERGGPILYGHTNKVVGKIIDYEFKKKDGKPALWLQGEIFKHYEFDDAVWEAIKQGYIKGFSLGGRANPSSKRIECDETGSCFTKIEDLEVFEFSVVPKGANPEATIESHNLAKEEKECPPKPEKKKKIDIKKMYDAIKAYILKKQISELHAHEMVEKCPLCKDHVDYLKSTGIDEATALRDLQNKLNSILEETKEMSTETEETQKQEEVSLEAILAKLTQMDERIAALEGGEVQESEEPPKEEEEEEDKEKPEEEEEKAILTKDDMKKIFQESMAEMLADAKVSTTPRTTDLPEEIQKTTVDLTQLKWKDLIKMRMDLDPKMANIQKLIPLQ